MRRCGCKTDASNLGGSWIYGVGRAIERTGDHAEVKKLMSSVKKKLKDKIKSRFVFFLASHGYLDEEDEESWMCCHGANVEALRRLVLI